MTALVTAGGFPPAWLEIMVFFTGRRLTQWLIPQLMVFSMGFQDLVMVPEVTALAQGFRTAAKDVLHGPPLCAKADDFTNAQLNRLDGLGTMS